MTEYALTYGDYNAQVRSSGAGLNYLSYKGKNLIDVFRESEPEMYRGDILAPWPNRIGDGEYTVSGYAYSVPINEPSRNTALHGLVNTLEWKLLERSEHMVLLEVDLPESEKYPTSLRLRSKYELSSEGIEIKISAINTGKQKAPYGVSIHPYLIANSSSQNNDWTLHMNSNEVLEVDLKRLLPIRLVNVDALDFDFRKGAVVGSRFIDHAFTVDRAQPRVIEIRGRDQSGVQMAFDETSKWIQIHTADRDGGDTSRTCLAVEPMTCPPDAFRTGTDLIWLESGDETSSSWSIKYLKGEIDGN